VLHGDRALATQPAIDPAAAAADAGLIASEGSAP
jgi:hypothetical protein